MLARRKWTSFPSISIPEYSQKTYENNDTVIVFKIDVKDGTESWTIYKRYSEFVNLHNQLKERFQEKSLPSLPPKRSIFDLGVLLLRDDKFMEQRRVLLEHYLKTLLLEAHVFQTSEVRAFLDPASETQKKKQSEETFLLPPPPQQVRLPHVIKLKDTEANIIPEPLEVKGPSYIIDENGNKVIELSDMNSQEQKKKTSFNTDDVCFLNVILSSIKDNLEYIAFLKEELDSLKTDKEKLHVIEQKRVRLDTTVSTLRKERSLLSQIVQLKSVFSNAPLSAYFMSCIEAIDKGLKWEAGLYFRFYFDMKELEEELLDSMFNSNESTLKIEDLGAIVAQYETMAEKLAMEFLLQTDISKQYAVAQQISLLKEKVESTIQSAQFQKKTEHADRLKQVMKYIQENFSHLNLKKNGKEEMDNLD